MDHAAYHTWSMAPHFLHGLQNKDIDDGVNQLFMPLVIVMDYCSIAM